MTPAILAACAVVLTMCAVAAVVRVFVRDMVQQEAAFTRIRAQQTVIGEELDEHGVVLDRLEKTADKHATKLDTAHEDLMQLFDHTGAKRDRL